MSQMREVTLNYDNASKHADEMMIMNSNLDKRFATEMNISMKKVSPTVANKCTKTVKNSLLTNLFAKLCVQL